MSAVCIVAARRTPVAPRGGALAAVEPAKLAEAPVRAVLADAGVSPDEVDEVILGNALYGGGNLARVLALGAGIPETVPAMTIDTQCCAGLDAVLLAASRIAAGDARVAIAGGVESFSRAPFRLRRPTTPDEKPEPYDRPPFTPWPERDPDMAVAAAALAVELGITRAAQERFAIESHAKARGAAEALNAELVPVAGLAGDSFTRRLGAGLCGRLPVLAGDALHGVTSATVAVEADAAAAVLVVAEALVPRCRNRDQAVRIVGGMRRGGDPERPGLAPVAAAAALLQRFGLRPASIRVAEIMEAFAVQAIGDIQGIGLRTPSVNRGGGALARGHPIGASGAILAVRLWHELKREPAGTAGLAAIAAAGGLGTALLVAKG